MKRRGFTILAAAGLLMMCAAILFLAYQSYMTRRMLDARGGVQTTVVAALCRERVMTSDECGHVRSLYGEAEYPGR